MTRMTRPPLNTLARLSLALLVATVATWWVTHARGHRAIRLHSAPDAAHFLVLGDGGALFVSQQATLPADCSWTVDADEYARMKVRATGPAPSPLTMTDHHGTRVRPEAFNIAPGDYLVSAPPGRLRFVASRIRVSSAPFTTAAGRRYTSAVTLLGSRRGGVAGPRRLVDHLPQPPPSPAGRPMQRVRLRPPRHPGPLPRMRHPAGRGDATSNASLVNEASTARVRNSRGTGAPPVSTSTAHGRGARATKHATDSDSDGDVVRRGPA